MGGSSGGGSSGKVDYPYYMKDIHADWLTGADSDGVGGTDIESSMVDAMNNALGSSPFTSAVAYDPEVQLDEMDTAIEAFETRYTNALADMNYDDVLSSLKTSLGEFVPTEAEIAASVAAFSASLNNEIEEKILPRFQRGMQDINAVQSSSFVLGEAMINEESLRKVAEYEAELRLKTFNDYKAYFASGVELYTSLISTRLNYADIIAKLRVEKYRMAIVAYKEQYDKDFELDQQDALWDLEVFKYGGNLLAAISGASSVSTGNQTNKTVSALGGALSGAAAGAQIGSSISPGYGTAIGAVVGAVAGGIGGMFS